MLSFVENGLSSKQLRGRCCLKDGQGSPLSLNSLRQKDVSYSTKKDMLWSVANVHVIACVGVHVYTILYPSERIL